MTSAPVDDDARPLTHRHHHPIWLPLSLPLSLEVPFSLLLVALFVLDFSKYFHVWKFRSSKLTHFEVNVDLSYIV